MNKVEKKNSMIRWSQINNGKVILKILNLERKITRRSFIVGLLNVKSILVEEQQRYYLTYNKLDKRVHTFSKGINLKVNVTARMEFELIYYEAALLS